MNKINQKERGGKGEKMRKREREGGGGGGGGSGMHERILINFQGLTEDEMIYKRQNKQNTKME